MAAPFPTAIPPGPPTEFPSVELRVCDLHVLSLPSGASDYFTVDGLYVVVRYGSQVHRTACLWESDLADEGDRDKDEEGDTQFLSFEDTTWNELFVLTFQADDEAARTLPASQMFPSAAGLLPVPTSILGSTTGSPNSISPGAPQRSTPPTLRTPSTPRGHAQPSIEVELWRSTSEEESHIGMYRFVLPSEFSAAQTSKSLLKNGVLDKVLPLQNASAFDHRLGVRVRVRLFGVSVVPSTSSSVSPSTLSATTTGVLGHSGRLPLYGGLYSHAASGPVPGGLLGYPSGSSSGTSPSSLLSRPSLHGTGLMGAGPSSSSIYPVPLATSNGEGSRMGVVGSGMSAGVYAPSMATYPTASARGVLGVGGILTPQMGFPPAHTMAGAVDGRSTNAEDRSGGSSPALTGQIGGAAVLGDGVGIGGSGSLYEPQGGLQLPSSTGALFPSAPVPAPGSFLPAPSTPPMGYTSNSHSRT